MEPLWSGIEFGCPGLKITDHAISLDVLVAGPKDQPFCSTQAARLTYTLEYGALKKQRSEVVGKLSWAFLTAAEYTAVEIDGKPLPTKSKPPTAQFEGGRIAEFGGCNHYKAPIKESAPVEIVFWPVAGTPLAFSEPAAQVDDHFLASLGKAMQYAFLPAGCCCRAWRAARRTACSSPAPKC